MKLKNPIIFLFAITIDINVNQLFTIKNGIKFYSTYHLT